MATEKKKKSFLKGKYTKPIVVMLIDVVFAVIAYICARTIVYTPVAPEQMFLQYEFLIAIVFVVVVVLMLIFFDCYNSVWKYAGKVELFKLLLAYMSSFALLFIFGIIINQAFAVYFPAALTIIMVMFSAILSSIIRFFYAISNYVFHIRGWIDDKAISKSLRTIIIGAGYTGTMVINRCINNPAEGYYPVALIDDDEEKHGKKIYGVLIEGGMDSLGEVIKKHRAQKIIIAIAGINKSGLKSIYEKCAAQNLPIKVMSLLKDPKAVMQNTLELRDIKIEELLGREEFHINHELIDGSIKDKVVMVTGGAGSIGSELCRQALIFGCKHLVIYDNHENGMFALNEEFKNIYDTDRYSLCIGSVREKQKLKVIMDKFRPSIVFHAAAYKHVPMMEIASTEAIKNNVLGTRNVIEQAEKSGVDRFIFISTDKAVNPANVMGASKRIAEMVIQDKGRRSKMHMAAVRFGNVLGSNGSVIPIFLKQIKEGKPITLTDRNIKRYFMTIPEAVRLVMQAGALASDGDIFVLDMGEPVYIYDLACDLIRISGLVPEQDVPIIITGLRPGEKLFEELRYDSESTDKTVHDGIFVTKMEEINEKAFLKQLATLEKNATVEDEDATTDTVFSIVPSEYRNKGIEEQIKSKEFIDQGSR